MCKVQTVPFAAFPFLLETTSLNHTFLRPVAGLQYDNIVHVYNGNTNVNNDSLDYCAYLRQAV